jgi:hypothetical protein
MKDAQKKAKQAGMPVADVEWVMMASAAILPAQFFLQEVDDWEGSRPSTARGEPERLPSIWPTSNASANFKHLGWGVHWVAPMLLPQPLPQPLTGFEQPSTTWPSQRPIHHSSPAADGVKLGSLLVDHHAHHGQKRNAKAKPTSPPAAMPGASKPVRSTNTPFLGNYCWTHGHQCSQHHSSVTCGNKATSHKENVTAVNTMGGCKANKAWNTRT